MKYLRATLALLFLMPAVSYAALYEGMERDVCFKNQSNIHIAYECLSKKSTESSHALDNIIAETNKHIKINNPGPVFRSEDPKLTIGDIYSKSFLAAQADWKAYRGNLCLAVASQIGEDANDYQSYIDQCVINLNKRHVEEIKMMDIKSGHS